MERNKWHFWGLSLALALPMTAIAQNIIRTTAPIPQSHEIQWKATESSVGPWANEGAPTACTNWEPAPDTVGLAISFTQNADDCEQRQIRTIQDREISESTGAIRDIGAPRKESRIVSGSMTRNAIGTMESWVVADASYSAWVNTGNIYGCSTWLPSPTTKPIGTEFVQTANDCKQDQTRQKQNREQETYTLAYRNVGSPVIENQVLSDQTLTRQAIGSQESWVSIAPIYSEWVNTGALTGCIVWTPSPASVSTNSTFTQSAGDCTQAQGRTRQDREQEATTLAIRNIGTPAQESRTLSNQTAYRSFTVNFGAWTNTSGIYDCATWSPNVTAVQKATQFTQTSNDCKLDQSRTRNESYVDHISGNTVTLAAKSESRTISASLTRTATGTKVVPVCGYSYGGAVEGWRFFAQGNSIWTGSLHSSVPSMWFGQDTMQVPFSNPAQYPANLYKTSATEFVYHGSGFQWRIYRGAFVGNVDGFVMYQVCIE